MLEKKRVVTFNCAGGLRDRINKNLINNSTGEIIMGKPVLLMLNPWFDDGDIGPFYCPACGTVEGFLAYNPAIRKQLEIIFVDFKRPRPKIIKYLGEENQGSPVLVLDDSDQVPDGAKKSLSTGKTFVDDPTLICNYLGSRFKGVRPHP